MSVLIMTFSEDNEGVDAVIRAVRELGSDALRFDTDLFPTDLVLTAGYGSEATRTRFRPPGAERNLTLDEVTAVWNRRFYTARGLPKDLDRQLAGPSKEESHRTVLGLTAALPVFALDPLIHSRHARHKTLQLRLATELGLEVPPTIITNDPEEVRAFAARTQNGLITKMMSPFAVYDEGGKETVVFTNKLSGDDLENLEGLDLCPMTFQENVPKKLELRTTVVGKEMWTASIDSQSSDRAKTDWRRDGAGMIDQWQEYELPDDVRESLFALHDRLGLNYGASDFIVTPDGRHVFLEVNPVGEYYWLEKWTGFPLTRAIAGVLVDPSKRRLPQ